MAPTLILTVLRLFGLEKEPPLTCTKTSSTDVSDPTPRNALSVRPLVGPLVGPLVTFYPNLMRTATNLMCERAH